MAEQVLEIIKDVRNVGNSGGVLVPLEWLGKQVKVILIDRTDEIKKEVFKILDPYMQDLQGIYLVGSYARKEQGKGSDIDILAISTKISKKISSGNYNIEIYPLKSIRKSLESNSIMIYPRLLEAKALLNEGLLEELKKFRPSLKSFKVFFDDCKRIIKIDKEFIELDKLDGDILESAEAVAYSLVLRLRGVYLIECVIGGKVYSNEGFRKWGVNGSEVNKGDFEQIYEAYRDVKEDKKPSQTILIKNAEKLLNFLRKGVKKYA